LVRLPRLRVIEGGCEGLRLGSKSASSPVGEVPRPHRRAERAATPYLATYSIILLKTLDAATIEARVNAATASTSESMLP